MKQKLKIVEKEVQIQKGQNPTLEKELSQSIYAKVAARTTSSANTVISNNWAKRESEQKKQLENQDLWEKSPAPKLL